MHSHVYVVVCLDTAGWRQDAIWTIGYQVEKDRVFATLEAADECYHVHADYDYTATAFEPVPAGSLQPEFEVQKIPTVEAVYMAAIDDDVDLIERIIEVAKCPPLPCDDDTPSIERVIAWIRTLPREPLEATRKAERLDIAADAAHRMAASTAGASSVTHGYALAGEYLSVHATALQRIIAHCLKS